MHQHIKLYEIVTFFIFRSIEAFILSRCNFSCRCYCYCCWWCSLKWSLWTIFSYLCAQQPNLCDIQLLTTRQHANEISLRWTQSCWNKCIRPMDMSLTYINNWIINDRIWRRQQECHTTMVPAMPRKPWHASHTFTPSAQSLSLSLAHCYFV